MSQRSLMMNDLNWKPLNGPRDQSGVLLADKGVGGVVILNQNNWEIFR